MRWQEFCKSYKAGSLNVEIPLGKAFGFVMSKRSAADHRKDFTVRFLAFLIGLSGAIAIIVYAIVSKNIITYIWPGIILFLICMALPSKFCQIARESVIHRSMKDKELFHDLENNGTISVRTKGAGGRA